MKVRGRLGGILFGLVLLPIGIRAEEAVHGEPPIVWSLVVRGNRRVPDSAIRFHLRAWTSTGLAWRFRVPILEQPPRMVLAFNPTRLDRRVRRENDRLVRL